MEKKKDGKGQRHSVMCDTDSCVCHLLAAADEPGAPPCEHAWVLMARDSLGQETSKCSKCGELTPESEHLWRLASVRRDGVPTHRCLICSELHVGFFPK